MSFIQGDLVKLKTGSPIFLVKNSDSQYTTVGYWSDTENTMLEISIDTYSGLLLLRGNSGEGFFFSSFKIVTAKFEVPKNAILVLFIPLEVRFMFFYQYIYFDELLTGFIFFFSLLAL